MEDWRRFGSNHIVSLSIQQEAGDGGGKSSNILLAENNTGVKRF